ncbi:hypothetical protein J4050_00620 [Winogradskyella sp. DF17]|uniref:Asparagine synthetase domain-containing protein n=1 Tax=Winogradskyella pelagia TaxID=2819984 RepID=A0ABS3SXL2_9FLAO|nr:hypothetical protein [Winogradskyella sp. DF17]MBO3115228.1 hypothetical protein [Winogradskyella sp. DF17]
MYSKSLKVGKTIVEIKISEEPYHADKDFFLFGSVINIECADKTSLSSFANSLKGYWVRIDIAQNSITLTSDILGGYRVYWSKIEGKILVSDDYNFILEKLERNISKNENEYIYWQKHRYTTGQSTFINEIKKLSPASILEIKDNSITELSYFNDLERTPSIINHKTAVEEDLDDTFKCIKEKNRPVLLFFSGGKDSCLLLNYIIKYNIPYKAIYFKLNPISKIGAKDVARVRAISQSLKIPLEELQIDLGEVPQNKIDEIVNKQLFDRHFSILHYIGTSMVREKYGKDYIIINGQSSDSILSFGPSENSLMSYFRRLILYRPNSFRSIIGLFLLNIKTKRKFILPKSDTQKLIALFDEFKYSRVLDDKMTDSYMDYISDYLQRKTAHLKSFYSKEMYVKILSFCQGSDNQVVVNSSKQEKMETIMPFATPNIVYSTVRYKNEDLEISRPKYIIDMILEEKFLFYYNDLRLQKIDINDVHSTIKNNAYDEKTSRFYRRVNQLLNTK